MSIHGSANIAVECAGESCRICRLIDPSSPIYSEHYRRLFFPAEFPADAIAPPARATPPPAAPPTPLSSPQVPLAGDVVASLTAAVGADRAARWVAEKLTGVPDCGCDARRVKLNAIDLKARRLLARLGRKPG